MNERTTRLGSGVGSRRTEQGDGRDAVSLAESYTEMTELLLPNDTKVDVRPENPQTGEYRETTTSFFTFVALNGSGRPTTVPELTCPTDEEAALREAAVEDRHTQLEDVTDRLE